MIVGIPRNNQEKDPAGLREALLIRGGRRYVPV
jgi:hypothetical protein